MSRPPRTDDNPFVSIFMVGLIVVVAVGGIWLSTREKGGGGPRYSDSPPDMRSGSSRVSSSNAPRFVDAFKRLPKDAVSLQQAADAEFDGVARMLGANELAQVQKIMSRNNQSRDSYAESELDTLRRHGFGKWLRAKAISWSHDDPSFHTAAGAVWNRSSRARDEGEMTELAVKWGEMDRAGRLSLLQIIQAVESKTRELSSSEREAVINFAGEDYLTSRQ